MNTPKRFLVISRRPPYGSSHARDALDTALTTAVFEQPVSMLFLDDGVYQLLQSQEPAAIQQKNLGATLSALPMYDIDQLYACNCAMHNRGLVAEDCLLPVQLLDEDGIAQLIRSHDVVMSF
ncbi:sulfurtransferase complex subunit TusC [Marinobacterium rhizophilum]|uniref:Sulfurtransferase complex subunit TusC n=1 Tax=Marinobacterium rhizophilum TaxID=420402 RepID=A0ABY5HM69_9GAMM|nr:sulfurtransferase complex subunit TusC [Marinobacterium rhizophilum]UTW13497.1 sulfurtransferase complex subunit TusC [Marinobacterium rhizophilum]